MKKALTSILLTLSATTFAQIPSYVPSNGLVGWWPFNSNANDESGNGNNGTVNGATLTTDRFGVADKAYSFDGVNDYVSTFRPGYLSFSISIWYKVTGPILPLSYPLVDGFDSYYDLYFTNQGLFYASFTGLNQYSNIYCGLSLTQDQWKHLVLVYNNNVINIYSNSDLVGTYNVQSLTGTAGNHFFGASLTGTDQFLKGSLDDIGIWNRPLTACEIKDLYNSEPGSQNTFSSQSQTAIDSYTWPVNGQTYTQSGVYIDTLVNAAGCDSIVTLNLELDFTGIESNTPTTFKLYPNPVKDVMTLVGLKGEGVSFVVYSVDGKLIKNGQTSGEIQLEDLKKGNYILKIENESLPFVKL